MKTLKVYLLSAGLLLAGFGIANAQTGAKMKGGDKKGGDKKGGSSTQMAIKNQGAPSTTTKGASSTNGTKNTKTNTKAAK